MYFCDLFNSKFITDVAWQSFAQIITIITAFVSLKLVFKNSFSLFGFPKLRYYSAHTSTVRVYLQMLWKETALADEIAEQNALCIQTRSNVNSSGRFLSGNRFAGTFSRTDLRVGGGFLQLLDLDACYQNLEWDHTLGWQLYSQQGSKVLNCNYYCFILKSQCAYTSGVVLYVKSCQRVWFPCRDYSLTSCLLWPIVFLWTNLQVPLQNYLIT